MLPLRLGQGISSGCHNATPAPKKFCICHYCGKGALCFRFDLTKVFLQGATMPPLHPKDLDYSLLLEGALSFFFDLAKYFVRVPPCHPYTPNFFLDLSLLGEGALFFCFDLAKVFLQGATIPPLGHFFWNCR